MGSFLTNLFAGGGVAHAMSRAGGGGGDQPSLLIQMAPFLMVFAVIYFVMIRPQQKRQQEHRAMLEALKAGDQVLSGGIFGEITKIKDDVITLKVADNVRIRVHRSAVTGKVGAEKPPEKTPEKAADKAPKES